MQTPAPLRRLNLPCIAPTDGHDAAGGDDGGLENVHVLATHRVIQEEVVAVVFGDLEVVELVKGATALVRHIVDRQH